MLFIFFLKWIKTEFLRVYELSHSTKVVRMIHTVYEKDKMSFFLDLLHSVVALKLLDVNILHPNAYLAIYLS